MKTDNSVLFIEKIVNLMGMPSHLAEPVTRIIRNCQKSDVALQLLVGSYTPPTLYSKAIMDVSFPRDISTLIEVNPLADKYAQVNYVTHTEQNTGMYYDKKDVNLVDLSHEEIVKNAMESDCEYPDGYYRWSSDVPGEAVHILIPSSEFEDIYHHCSIDAWEKASSLYAEEKGKEQYAEQYAEEITL